MKDVYTLETGVVIEGGNLESVSDSVEKIKGHVMYMEKDVNKFFKRCSRKKAIWYRLIKKWDMELGGYELIESTYYEPDSSWSNEFSWGTVAKHRLKQKKLRKNHIK